MDLRKSPERPITRRAQLLVEGRTPLIFFTELQNNIGIQEIEIHDFGAVGKLLGTFPLRPSKIIPARSGKALTTIQN